MEERRSLTVRSGITQGVCSTVVLPDVVFVDILGEAFVGNEREGGNQTSRDRGRLRDSKGRGEEREAGRTNEQADFYGGIG